MTPPDDHREKDRPESPSSDKNLFCEIIDALPFGVSFCVVFVAFFFFWGAAINALKFIGSVSHKSMPPLGNGAGSLIGAICATAVAFVLWKVKTRRK